MNSLLKQVKVYKGKYNELLNEFKYLKSLIKTTQITEVKIENELYKRELIRLRTLLEKEIGKKMADSAQKAKQDKPVIQHQSVRICELEQMLHTLRKSNTNQGKMIIELTDKLRSYESASQRQ